MADEPPDLVLLDCMLPDVSGFEVCKRIRTLFSKAQLPVIMLSARHHEQVSSKLKQAVHRGLALHVYIMMLCMHARAPLLAMYDVYDSV